ncbi:MAG: hypothetical protein M3512_10175 [Bacteroidota bacterium]|nr:hypothetical protein [Bacteroidota bacterium]
MIDHLPSSYGYSVYHLIQKLLQSNKLENKVPANLATFGKVKSLLMKVNHEIENKNILEIGSGWMPLIPFFFKYIGKCNDLFTYDLNEHYDKSNVTKVIQYFNKNYGLKISDQHNNKYNLPDWLVYKPKENVIDAELPDKIDFIFSRFVLEHVPPEQIFFMHKKFKETYDTNTLIVHMISPSDHRSYVDGSISLVDFLQFSQDEWDNRQTKFDYHNRLRLPQYLEIFKKLDFEILHVESQSIKKDSKEYEKFRKLKIHNDFSGYSEEELTAGGINIIMRRKDSQ